MKIGFSFGRCVRDIVNDVVKFDDVLMIISGTSLINREDISPMIDSYMHKIEYLVGCPRDKCIDIANRLWDRGLIYQPRLHGSIPNYIPKEYLWADIAPSPRNSNTAIQEAWDRYKMLVTLSGDPPNEPEKYWKVSDY